MMGVFAQDYPSPTPSFEFLSVVFVLKMLTGGAEKHLEH